MSSSVLDNPAWHALTTFHSSFAEVSGSAVRYHPDVSVFAAVPSLSPAAWADLASFEHVVLSQVGAYEVAAGWALDGGGIGHQLVCTSPALVDPPPDAVALGVDDVDEMVALVALAQPGPFRPRTVELGSYWGVRSPSSGALVAMAGERMHLPGFVEVSAVCTHPEWRGRGLAAGLTSLVAAGVLDRGEVPMLHVAEGNPARSVYERLGFAWRADVQFSVLSRLVA